MSTNRQVWADAQLTFYSCGCLWKSSTKDFAHSAHSISELSFRCKIYASFWHTECQYGWKLIQKLCCRVRRMFRLSVMRLFLQYLEDCAWQKCRHWISEIQLQNRFFAHQNTLCCCKVDSTLSSRTGIWQLMMSYYATSQQRDISSEVMDWPVPNGAKAEAVLPNNDTAWSSGCYGCKVAQILRLECHSTFFSGLQPGWRKDGS